MSYDTDDYIRSNSITKGKHWPTGLEQRKHHKKLILETYYRLGYKNSFCFNFPKFFGLKYISCSWCVLVFERGLCPHLRFSTEMRVVRVAEGGVDD